MEHLDSLQKAMLETAEKIRDASEKPMTVDNVNALQALAWAAVHWCDSYRVCRHNLDLAAREAQ